MNMEFRYDVEMNVTVNDLMFDEGPNDMDIIVRGRLQNSGINTLLDGGSITMEIQGITYDVWIVTQSDMRYEDGTIYVEVSIMMEMI